MIPPELGSILTLQQLNVAGNRLTSKIPPELGKLVFLRELSLFGNSLVRKIPPELGNLLHLRALSLGGNPWLVGEFPTELSELSHVTFLVLDGSPLLTGCLPGHWRTQLHRSSEIGGLPFCDRAQIPQGPVPPLSDRYALVELYYAAEGQDWKEKSNWLSAKPLDEWHGVTTDSNGRVTELSLVANNVKDEIPLEINYLTKLERLDLSQNRIEGEVPSELGGLTNLKYLSLKETDLRGCIPSSLKSQLDMWKSDLGGLSFCE